MLKEDSSNRVGNDRYEGFLVDLLEKLAGVYNINFELQEQSDGRYGARDESGNWSGKNFKSPVNIICTIMNAIPCWNMK